jgi:hypothetical protein
VKPHLARLTLARKIAATTLLHASTPVYPGAPMIASSSSLCMEQMPNPVDSALLLTMSNTELSYVRTELERRRDTDNRSVTSSTSVPPACDQSVPWQCACADASPGECSDVASPG